MHLSIVFRRSSLNIKALAAAVYQKNCFKLYFIITTNKEPKVTINNGILINIIKTKKLQSYVAKSQLLKYNCDLLLMLPRCYDLITISLS